MAIQVFLFDHFRLIDQDREIAHFSSSRAENLIAYLALHAGTAVKRQFLAFQLWPDSNESQALSNLRKVIYTLRHDLPDINTLLTIEYETIQIAGAVQLDVTEFRNLLELAAAALKSGDTSSAVQALAKAVQIYQGDLLPDCYDEWVIVEREILAQEYERALTRLAELYEFKTNPNDAIYALKLLLARDPLQELAYQKLMMLYAQINDRVAALGTYHTCVMVLQRELGVSPSPKTQNLYSELLSQSELPDLPDKDSIHQAQVGRKQELETLKQAWRQMNKTGHAKLVLIAGEAGVGKTHLAETMLNGLQRQGIRTYKSRCYPAEGSLSFSPLIEWMRAKNLDHLNPKMRLEIGRILPEVLEDGTHLPPPLIEKEHRRFFFEAIVAALNQPDEAQLFFLDDLQYCDHDTLECLHYFLHTEIKSHTMVIATCRYDETDSDHPLLPMLYSLSRMEDRLDEIVLKPFSREETEQLANQMSGQPLPEQFLDELYQITEGNPLFITESMRAYLSQSPEVSSRAWTIPKKVKMVIEARLNHLSPLARKLAGTAAVIGRDIDLGLLQTVSDLGEDEFLDGLDELWGRGILHQEEGSRYSFSHHLIRESTYLSTAPARRQSLHRKVAAALEGSDSPHRGPLDALIARHYAEGNRGNYARQAYIRAAVYAKSIYSIEETIRLTQKALDLNREENGTLIDRQDEQQIQEILGEALLIDGQHEEARRAFLAALQVTDEEDELARSRLLEKSGATLHIQYRSEDAVPDLEKAEGLISRGIQKLDKARMQVWIQIQLDRMWGNFVTNRPDAISLLAGQLRQPLEVYGTPLQKGQFFQNLVGMELRRSRYVLWTPDARSYALSAIEIFKEHNLQNDLAFAIFETGFCAMWTGWRGEYDQAESDMTEALQLAERIGNKLVKARCLSYLLTLYRKYNRQDQFNRILQPARSAAWDMRHMGEFTVVVDANLAWYAYANADFEKCAEYCQAALKISQSFNIQRLFYPFYWTGSFPGAAVALIRSDLPTAAGFIQRMLEPGQQLLHPQVATSLEEALAAWKNHEESLFTNCLSAAIDLAHEWGYL